MKQKYTTKLLGGPLYRKGSRYSYNRIIPKLSKMELIKISKIKMGATYLINTV